jgi:uroporphyrin-III C-methyltransferase/precorrin-2 dehydrogenase/sirohydrochlorin ferrochelatase
MMGFVSLVGAGPGDPDLLTRKAARVLAEADLILFDALVAPEALELAPRAQRFFVGKRARRMAIRQETIHGLMIRAARRGKRVVRLKCGDPFLLGRGGEEALALTAAGIPFEVVPGISSAIAAPELAGIPVTHRGVASGFAVLSGHAEEAYRPILSSIAPNSLTLVVLMGLSSRASLAEFLLSRGWPRRTPAAILLAASTPSAFVWTGALEELGEATLPEDRRDAPGTLVIGEVVSVASRIGRFDSLPGTDLAEGHQSFQGVSHGRR